VWHEYGHAIQGDQVLDFGWTEQAKAIGEGFGDYMAVTMSQATAKNTKLTPLACVMDWDATYYTSKSPHCLRRTDLNLHYPKNLTGEPHYDGQIWSRALWDMNRELGRNKATRIIIEAQFWMNPKVTMPEAAQITVWTARKLYGDSVGATTHRSFARRGIL
jgi:Zn-dependent metalloprotease